MPIRLLVLLSLFLASCDRSEKTALHLPAGRELPNLPSSSFSRELETDDSGFIEIVFSHQKNKLFHQGKHITSTFSEEELFAAIQSLREKNTKADITSPLLVSALPTTPFHDIKQQIRTAAETGIHEVLFLVRPHPASDDLGVLSIDLPVAGLSLPDIEPLFLHVNSDGHIFSGTGASRSRMDTGPHDRYLEKLSAQLELYRTAAESAGVQKLFCQIHIHPQATYQRAIDLISLMNRYRIKPFFTDMRPEARQFPKSLPRKPSPPN